MKIDIDDLFNKHAPIYHALLKPLRHLPIRLLEIGIGTVLPGYRPGASLRAWRDYFANPHARIYGMDVQPDTTITDEPRITTMLCSSIDAHSVNEVLAGKIFDVVIDDGSHIAEEQIFTLKNIWPFLAPNGIYVIEDVNRIDHNQGRILVDYQGGFDALMAEWDALYFTVSLPKADVIVISARDR